MNIKNQIQNLISKGLDINCIYDIGGWMGHWTEEMSKSLLSQKEFIIFEANPYYYDALSKLGKKVFIDILSDKKNIEIEFYDSPLSGESYYKENTNYYKEDIPKKRITNTLDSLIEENNLNLPDFIKIDTQGSELDILKGGIKALNNAKIVYAECPIVKYNLGAPNIHQYLDFFDNNNFYPLNILENHYMDDILVQIDILFIKKEIKKIILGENKSLLI